MLNRLIDLAGEKMQQQERAIELLNSRQSLIISTLNANGVTETSVAATFFDGQAFYIFTSELSQHTKNLVSALRANQKTNKDVIISGLLLADEAETEQMFARERMSFQLKVSEVLRDDLNNMVQKESSKDKENSNHQTVLKGFKEHFGDVVVLLQSLPDFHLFKLSPRTGTYVVGFGQAFAFEKLPHYGLKAIKD